MMDVFSVDLTSSQQFQQWYLTEIERETAPTAIVDALRQVGTTDSLIRALTVAYWDNLPEFENLTKTCLELSDLVAGETVKGYAVYRRSIALMREGGPNMAARLLEMKGALSLAQKQLTQLPQSNLAVEAQIGIIIALTVILLHEDRCEEAIEWSSQAMFLAEQLGGTITVARVRANLIGCSANAGHTSRTIALIQEDRGRPFRYSWRYTELELASCLMRFGNYDEGMETLQSLMAVTEGVHRERALEGVQRYKALWGTGGLEGQIYPTAYGSEPQIWMTESLRYLIQAFALPREGKDAEERYAHLQRIITTCRTAEASGMPMFQWRRVFAHWITATAHLGRGEFSNAAGILEHIEEFDPEWLDIRVLILGAGLELSLTWNAPEEVSTPRYEHLLRKVFKEAEKLRYASPAGLARLLHRWHPTAAAYLALMPDPIHACTFASNSVLKVGQVNHVYGDITLPPVYACDLVLRSLDFDLRRDFNFQQTDPGSSRKKKKDLFVQVGEVRLWRLPVSAVKIAYGLMRYQNDKYHERARAIVQTYGIRPATSALYPMLGTLEDVERLTKDLLQQHLTPKGFVARFRELR